jgi:hypothetical protein
VIEPMAILSPAKKFLGLTAFFDDVIVVIKVGVGELVLSQVFPDVLHRIEFWRLCHVAKSST